MLTRFWLLPGPPAVGAPWCRRGEVDEFERDVCNTAVLRPDDDRRAGAGERHANGAVGRVRAERLQERRVTDAVLLVQLVVEGVAQQLDVAADDRRAEHRGR